MNLLLKYSPDAKRYNDVARGVCRGALDHGSPSAYIFHTFVCNLLRHCRVA